MKSFGIVEQVHATGRIDAGSARLTLQREWLVLTIRQPAPAALRTDVSAAHRLPIENIARCHRPKITLFINAFVQRPQHRKRNFREPVADFYWWGRALHV